MKVSELKPGIMVRPIVNKYNGRRMKFKIRYQDASKRNLGLVPSTEKKKIPLLVCNAMPPGNEDADQIGIYVGTQRSDWMVDGVYTHHLILVEGQTAVMSGYEVRYLEQAV